MAGRAASGFASLSEYVAGLAKMYGENALIKDRQRVEQENQLTRWRAEQGPELLKYMSAHPENADDIARLAKGFGLDLEFARPSDTEFAAPIAKQITGATNPLQVPDINQIVQSLQASTRPQLAEPVLGGRYSPAQTPTLPSTQFGPGGATEDAGNAESTLPSMQYGPAQSPTVAKLEALAKSQLGRIGQQEQHAIDLEGGKSYATSAGSESGKTDVYNANFDTKAGQEQTLAESKALGENAPSVGAAKAANEKLLTPVLAQRAGAEQNARSIAEYAVKYDPSNVAKEVDLQAKKAAAMLDVGVLKQRAKNIETAKMNAVPLAAQLKTLSGLYAKAVQGDMSAMMAYHDMAQNLRPTIARATGYSGRITNVEMQIAGNMIPSIVLDNMSGNALLKFKTLEGLATYGPKVAAALPPDAPIESYMNEISRVVNENMANPTSPVISPDVKPGGFTNPVVNVKPSGALQRLRGQQGPQ